MAVYPHYFVAALFGFAAIVFAGSETALGASDGDTGCLNCHTGIEQFSEGPMMIAIQAMGWPSVTRVAA